jgi:hypothetical protein
MQELAQEFYKRKTTVYKSLCLKKKIGELYRTYPLIGQIIKTGLPEESPDTDNKN